MVGQLPLDISPRLPYSAENFLAHDGVRPVFDLCKEAINGDLFKIFFIVGQPRSGKTHLSIALSDTLSQTGFYPRLIDGRELGAKLSEITTADSKDVLIIDDAQEYLATLKPGESGPFVNVVEIYRRAKAAIVFLSSKEIEEFSFDEHIRSRVIPGGGLSIKTPAAEYLPRLIELMAKQRGIKLTEKKVNFLLKRLDRNIKEIEEYLERVNYLSHLFGRSIKFPLLSDAL